jgi:tetratricopeptide (TPR) repeat protein
VESREPYDLDSDPAGGRGGNSKEMADPQTRIFISYRREDSAGHVLALLPALRRHFGDRVFKDTDNIPPGEDFVRLIKRELESCSVLLAVIGRDWLTVQDPRLKTRRLDNPDDFLRIEVSTALKSERIRVIPVLVERSPMPSAADLPPDLAELTHRNALELSDARWESDVQLLIQAIQRAFTGTVEPTEAPAQRPELQNLEKRRAREITAHLAAGQEAFDAQDYEGALLSCEKALLLDPRHTEALELLDRARKATDDQKIETWLKEARHSLRQGDTGSASDYIDQALSIDPASEAALTLRKEMLAVRRERERERERARAAVAAAQRARTSLDDEDFDGAVRHADDALGLDPQSVAAHEVRSMAAAALDERRRQREARRRAKQPAPDAREPRSAYQDEGALLPSGAEEEQRARERQEQERRALEAEARVRADAAKIADEQRLAEAQAREHADAERERVRPPAAPAPQAVPRSSSIRRYGALGAAAAIILIAAIGLWQYQQVSKATAGPETTQPAPGTKLSAPTPGPETAQTTSIPARAGTTATERVGAAVRGTSPDPVALRPPSKVTRQPKKEEGQLVGNSAAPIPPKPPDSGASRSPSGTPARGTSPSLSPTLRFQPNAGGNLLVDTAALPWEPADLGPSTSPVQRILTEQQVASEGPKVADLLQRYVRAYNDRNVVAGKEVYPEFRLPEGSESALQLTDVKISVSLDGASASVSARETYSYKDPGANPSTAQATFTLRKQGDSWIIVSIARRNWRV